MSVLTPRSEVEVLVQQHPVTGDKRGKVFYAVNPGDKGYIVRKDGNHYEVQVGKRVAKLTDNQFKILKKAKVIDREIPQVAKDASPAAQNAMPRPVKKEKTED